MDDVELKDMTSDQLDDQLLKLKKEQFNLRFQRASGQLENTARIRDVRRNIARVKTLMQQRQTVSEAAISKAAMGAAGKAESA